MQALQQEPLARTVLTPTRICDRSWRCVWVAPTSGQPDSFLVTYEAVGLPENCYYSSTAPSSTKRRRAAPLYEL